MHLRLMHWECRHVKVDILHIPAMVFLLARQGGRGERSAEYDVGVAPALCLLKLFHRMMATSGGVTLIPGAVVLLAQLPQIGLRLLCLPAESSRKTGCGQQVSLCPLS